MSEHINSNITSVTVTIDNSNSIYYSIECKKLIKSHYTALEWASIHNNYDDVVNALTNGETLFLSKNNLCSKLCTQYYKLRNKPHPKKCKKGCMKSALYYCLINNFRAYKTIIKMLLCIDNKTDYICEVIRFFSKMDCICSQHNEYCKGYRNTFLNFSYVYDFMKRVLPNITKSINSDQCNDIILQSKKNV